MWMKSAIDYDMNYSGAVKGSFARSGAIREINSQAELELGHPLSPDEEVQLFHKYSPQLICIQVLSVYPPTTHHHHKLLDLFQGT